MIRILHNYLVLNKSLSFPGLGTLYIERTPALSDFINRQIVPPSFHYRFDRYFDTPDKDFFFYLATRKEMAEFEAIKFYTEWVSELKSKLKSGEKIELKDIGFFTESASGDIEFEPYSAIPTGYSLVKAERILRVDASHSMLVGEKETTTSEMSRFLEDKKQVEKEVWYTYAIIIVAIALLVLFFKFYKDGFSLESTGNQQKVEIRNR